MKQNNKKDALLDPDDLLKTVRENIDRINQRISEKRIIQVSDYRSDFNKTALLKQFLIEKCKFKTEEFSGLYLFFNKTEMESNGIAMYTGISRDVRVRLKDHVSGGDPAVASFAVLMARKKNKGLDDYFTSIAYKPLKDEAKEEKKEKVKVLKELVKQVQDSEMVKMYVTAIPIINFHELHATEAFIASHFKCEYNSFKTH